jgi:tRNA A37 threonylcarbamoyltransferase TsaD
MPVLGIETSCDETAAAVLADDGTVLAESVLSQAGHAAYGGVVPEIAARAHLQHLPGQVKGVLARAGLAAGALTGVAASAGPGLIGGLIVGSGFAKGLALAQRLPFVGVNHLEAHALTARLPGLVEGGAAFPYLLMLLSGGSAAPSMMRWEKPSTRWQNCSGWAGRAGRCWRSWRLVVTAGDSPCPGRCWDVRAVISASPG